MTYIKFCAATSSTLFNNQNGGYQPKKYATYHSTTPQEESLRKFMIEQEETAKIELEHQIFIQSEHTW